jgi:PTS system mannose-specific IID component
MLGNAINRFRGALPRFECICPGIQRSLPEKAGFSGSKGLRTAFMERSVLLRVFLRSLTVQGSFNFWRMQNLGFAYSLLPFLLREPGVRRRAAEAVERHLRMFNTHPYLAAPIIGAVVKTEEGGAADEEVDRLKMALMGPYAAIGDSFFWGVLKIFCAAGATLVALAGSLLAPLMFFILYSPAHFWVRGMGYLEGYRRGKGGIDFIRGLDLPGAGGRIRSFSPVLIGILAAVAGDAVRRSWTFLPGITAAVFALLAVLLFFLAVRRGISPLSILYGTTLLCMGLSI